MKKITFTIIAATTILFFSCKKSFLDEEPLDFLSTTNAYTTVKDFDAAVNNLYSRVRSEFYNSGEQRPFDYVFGCDLVFDGQPATTRHTNMVAAYSPLSTEIPLIHWTSLYKIIAESNTIIGRISASELAPTDRTLMEARAKFFRGMAFRTLAYLYGGVPLNTTEVVSPKTDYVRAPKTEVLEQAISDLKFASLNLPAINLVQDGEVNNLAAYHLLSEVYLAAGQFQNAADAASTVISNPNVGLMTTRFGVKASDATKNVYWDLFQRGNQNRKNGTNKESLWVIQFETDVPGGGAVSTGISGSYQMERHFAPQFLNFRLSGSSIQPFLYPISDYTGGRGIGWAIPTKYFSDVIWQSDFNNDLRNAPFNFVREFKVTNPAHPRFGQTISTINPPAGITVPRRDFYAFQSKVTTPGDHPDGMFQDKSQLLLKASAGGTYADQYMFRLAETYLLRAEAYFGLNQLDKAAADINVVRSRSNASAVLPTNVNMDYILDERMRELGSEEKRRITLMRLGLVYDRVKKCNPYYNDVLTTYNLWPIPASEIERNNGAKLEQNPGY
ncbi:Starch-binding protein SusD [Pedobacter sp. Bi27]|uniref:RagB/SusD family nutrient uptake outer membrane protein n=1 Tax=unclassified Pedobacter TaxID=2628915 RepID=UPI001E1A9EE1|nr:MULTISPECIES: RagB/SusD family nutrient uptake outer membrane protein [unclassified Pedobacter]CAH0305393.1 Starch-binding protein SusD [Pedobacter sp. Bi36]CAH0313800.1 Starch-binding protein SusD [Pedobacter sp. Bi27]CAH0314390.1 Starch-binding protein SusD [Pedobacter sp. Bi126]